MRNHRSLWLPRANRYRLTTEKLVLGINSVALTYLQNEASTSVEPKSELRLRSLAVQSSVISREYPATFAE